MGTDHGKNKVRIPLRKPKIIDAKTRKSSKTTVSDPQKRAQISGSSKKTTVTDPQKRGQTGLRYDLRAGKSKPNIKFIDDNNPQYRAKPSPGSKSRKQSRNRKKQAQPDVDYIIKPLYILPEGAKTKKKKGVMV